jgi:hypothetical protein
MRDVKTGCANTHLRVRVLRHFELRQSGVFYYIANLPFSFIDSHKRTGLFLERVYFFDKKVQNIGIITPKKKGMNAMYYILFENDQPVASI